MPVNFFDTNCQEAPIHAVKFGICDDGTDAIAYTDIENLEEWIAKVENPKAIEIMFTAIDNCVRILRKNGNEDNQCDGMLTYEDTIVFVELKTGDKRWKEHGINQVEVTVQYFIKHHNLDNYKHKRAFVCNSQHPRFQVINQETKQRFYNKYKVRLNIQTTIKIK